MKKNHVGNLEALKYLLLAWVVTFVSVSGHAATVNMVFDRSSGDRSYYFGTQNPAANFDVNPSLASSGWQAQSSGSTGTFTTTSKTGVWAVLNDDQPDTVQASSTQPNFATSPLLYGDTITVRTRFSSITSGVVGTPATLGVLFGLNGADSSTDGFMIYYQRTPGTSGTLALAEFENGEKSDILNQVSSTNSSVSGLSVGFIELSLTSLGGQVNYEVNLYSDTSISGSGSTSSRMDNSSWDSATPLLTLSGTLNGYSAGWLGLYFDAASSAGNATTSVTNFYAVPEPSAIVIVGLACGLLMVWRLRRKKSVA